MSKLDKKPILAAWQMLPSPQVTVAMVSLGFDWVVVDLEHTSLTTQEAEAIFIAAEKYGCKPYVRLPSIDPYLARRMLDAGAQGVILPVVEDRKFFDQFASHCFFPPKGKRGLGLVRANLWGEQLKEHFENFQPQIIAQIETRTGAQNIDEIIKSPFLDGVMVGPYDLSASLGKAGQFEDPEFLEYVNHIFQKAKTNNKSIGYHQVQPDLGELKKRCQEGYDFVAYGTDVVALRHALKGIKT
jgi:2-dehydro-3-deoxyglucarate aldolase